MKAKSITIGLIFSVILLGHATLVCGTTAVANPLSQQLQLLQQDARMRSASIGFVAIDINTGDTLASINPHEALVPASILKIVTTATAFELLGADYRFRTVLGTNGMVDPYGTLHGDLIVKGSGDPTFGATRFPRSSALDSIFSHWYALLKTAGIERVAGRVFVDESVFDTQLIPRAWLWENMGNHFGAGTSGMSAINNAVTIIFQPGQSVDQPAVVLRTEPQVPGMILRNYVTTGERNSGEQVWIFGAPYQKERMLHGTVPLGALEFPVRGSLPDPPLFVAESFSRFLNDRTIYTALSPTTHRIANLMELPVPTLTHTFGQYSSPQLNYIISQINLFSENSASEALVKTLGLQTTTPATFSAGLAVIRNFWQNAGISSNGMFLFDGSGLAPSNRITAGQMTAILKHVVSRPYFQQFQESLPLAGRSGTMQNVLRNTASEGVLRAKTGSLSNVRAFAGYTTTLSGRRVAFAFMVNHFHGTGTELRNEMVKVLDAITRYNQ